MPQKPPIAKFNSDLVFAVDLQMSSEKLLQVITFLNNFVQSLSIGADFTRLAFVTFDAKGIVLISIFNENLKATVTISLTIKYFIVLFDGQDVTATISKIQGATNDNKKPANYERYH